MADGRLGGNDVLAFIWAAEISGLALFKMCENHSFVLQSAAAFVFGGGESYVSIDQQWSSPVYPDRQYSTLPRAGLTPPARGPLLCAADHAGIVRRATAMGTPAIHS